MSKLIVTFITIVLVMSITMTQAPSSSFGEGSEYFMGRLAKIAYFDRGFHVRRVSTLCPDFPNPARADGWCSGKASPGTYFSMFLDPSPIGNQSGLERGFYSLRVGLGGVIGGDPQICKVNSTDCPFTFGWEKAENGNRVHIFMDTHTLDSGYVSFANRISNRHDNLYTGSWNHPLPDRAGTHIQIAGRVFNSDPGSPGTRTRFALGGGFGNPTSGNNYDIEINLARFGPTNPSGGSLDAWSPTEKYALIRVTNQTKGALKEIYIGAQAWGLPVLDLEKGTIATYDVDWSAIITQMVADGVIDPNDLIINPKDMPAWMHGDLNYWGIETGVGIETRGRVTDEMLLSDYTMFEFVSGTTTTTTTTVTTVPGFPIESIAIGVAIAILLTFIRRVKLPWHH